MFFLGGSVARSLKAEEACAKDQRYKISYQEGVTVLCI